MTAVSVLLMTAFAIKAAAFPLFFWLPASYHTPPFAVSAIFAGLLTKVGVYAMVRAFTTMFVQDVAFTHTILLVGAGLTMVVGVLGAAAQQEFRRVLSFHIVSQIGYMLMGLALFTPLAIAGTVFYVIHHIVVKANLFLVAGLAHGLRGTSSLKAPGRISLYRSAPLVCAVFLIAALSLAGVPPLSGFFAKFVLLEAGAEDRSWAIVAVAAAVGLLTLFSMTKIWAEAFWKGPSDDAPPPFPISEASGREDLPPSRTMVATTIALASLTVAIGVFAGPVFELAERTSAELLDADGYIRAVLGEGAAAKGGPA
jgi:multicomponent Na+:H+ antiporter subunit D